MTVLDPHAEAMRALLDGGEPGEVEPRRSRDDAARLVIERLADVEPEAVSWLWPGRFPLGKVVVVEGDPGLGKSTVTLDLAARVTTGTGWPDGSGTAPLGPVVILSAEDGPADTIRPRFDAAGGNAALAMIVTGVADDRGPGLVTLPDHLALLRVTVEHLGAKLVIVDPLAAYLSGAVNAHRDHDVRRALAPLAALAHALGCCVVVIRHLNKGIGPAIYRGGGSIGISGAARAVLVVAQDPDDAGRRVLAAVKSNLAPLPSSLTFTLEDVRGVARVAWGPESALTAGQLLAAQVQDNEDRGELEHAVSFLRDMLADGPRPTRDVERDARGAGVAVRTLDRARRTLGVRASRIGSGPWMIALSSDSQGAKAAPSPRVGTLGTLGTLPIDQGVSGCESGDSDKGCQPTGVAPLFNLEAVARARLAGRQPTADVLTELLASPPAGADPGAWWDVLDVVTTTY